MKFTTSSNVECTVDFSSFQNAHALNQAVLNWGVNEGSRFVHLLHDFSNRNIAELYPALLSAIANKQVMDALMRCMDKSTYARAQIVGGVSNVFDEPKNIEDFYEVAMEVAKVNLTPFMKSLLSLSNRVQNPAGQEEGQK